MKAPADLLTQPGTVTSQLDDLEACWLGLPLTVCCARKKLLSNRGPKNNCLKQFFLNNVWNKHNQALTPVT